MESTPPASTRAHSPSIVARERSGGPHLASTPMRARGPPRTGERYCGQVSRGDALPARFRLVDGVESPRHADVTICSRVRPPPGQIEGAADTLDLHHGRTPLGPGQRVTAALRQQAPGIVLRDLLVLGVDQHQRVQPRGLPKPGQQHAIRGTREVVDAGLGHEDFEAEHAGPVQPGHRRHVIRDQPTPVAVVHDRRAGRHAVLQAQRVERDCSGEQLSGISMTVVTPPAAAARVPVR